MSTDPAVWEPRLRLITSGLKLLYGVAPVAYFLFSFYRNQDDIVKRQAAADAALKTSQTLQEQQNTKISNLETQMRALELRVLQDLQHYQEVDQHSRRR